MSLSFKEWKEIAIVEYDVVSKNYNNRVYETIVENPDDHTPEFVQLTLREVINKCDGTNFENAIRKAIMKCVYTNSKLEKEIRKVMDEYYGI